MKTIVGVVILVLALLGTLTFGVLQNKEAAAETAVKGTVWWFLGIWPEVGGFKLDPREHLIKVRDLNIPNPEGFPPEDKWMLQVPEISAVYDPASFAQRKLLLKEFTVIVKELTIVRDRDKRINIETLRLIQNLKKRAAGRRPSAEASASVSARGLIPARRMAGGRPTAGKTSADRPSFAKAMEGGHGKEAAKKFPFKIDRLQLKLEWIVYKDYTQGKWPFVQETPRVFSETFRDITDLGQLKREIIARTIAGRAVNAFAQYQLGLFAPVSPALFSPQANEGSKILEELARTLLPFDTQ